MAQENCDFKVVFVLWLLALCYQMFSDRWGHYSLLLDFRYIAYGPWEPYTQHIFKSDIKEQQQKKKNTKWMQSSIESVSMLWLNFTQWLPEPPTLNLMTHCAKVYHSVDIRQLRLVEVTRTCAGVPSRHKKWAKGKWSDLEADEHDSVSNRNQWTERNWLGKSMRE